MSKPVALLAYQEADVACQQIETNLRNTDSRLRLNKVTKYIRQQSANLTKLSDDLEKHAAKLAQLQAQQQQLLKRLDLELSELDTLEGDEECTAEEMTEFRRDIEKLNREAGTLEKEIKALFTALEAAVQDYHTTRQQGSKAKKEYDQLKDVCQKEKDDAAIDLLAAEKTLEIRKKNVNPSLFKRYERARQHHGTPVVPVHSGKCSGCNMSIPMLTISRLTTDGDILECENCGRLLYADTDK